MAPRPSVSDILKAARSGSTRPTSESASTPTSPPAEKKVPKAKPAATEKAAKPATAARPAGGGMTVQEKIAAARAGASATAATKPLPTATESAVSGQATEPKVATPAKKAVAAKEVVVEPEHQPLGPPAPLIPILLSGWIGFAAIVALVYTLFGPTLVELASKP